MVTRRFVNDLSAERVRELLNYDPETGIFTRRVRVNPNAGPGDIAGSVVGRNGYCNIKIDCRTYLAHRLAWLHVHGRWPVRLIDHKDRNKLNNAISNLREATESQNRANLAAPRLIKCPTARAAFRRAHVERYGEFSRYSTLEARRDG